MVDSSRQMFFVPKDRVEKMLQSTIHCISNNAISMAERVISRGIKQHVNRSPSHHAVHLVQVLISLSSYPKTNTNIARDII